MEAVRQYLISIVCAALVAGILCDLTEKTAIRKQMRLACSLFLTIVVLRPLVDLRLPELDQAGNSVLTAARVAAEQGEILRVRSVAGIIKDEVESYIQKEAAILGAELTAEITLDAGQPPVPESVILRGFYDGTAEDTLSTILTRELGIPKERQTWIRQESHASEPS